MMMLMGRGSCALISRCWSFLLCIATNAGEARRATVGLLPPHSSTLLPPFYCSISHPIHRLQVLLSQSRVLLGICIFVFLAKALFLA